MKMPYSIPEWIVFCSELTERGIDVSFTTNAINGEHTADAFVGNRNVRFKMVKYANNLIVSFKKDEEIIRTIVGVLEEIFETRYTVKYHANGNKFCYNYEWYWECPSYVVEEQISRMSKEKGYTVLEVRDLKDIAKRQSII